MLVHSYIHTDQDKQYELKCVPNPSASLNAICIVTRCLESSQGSAASKNFVTCFEHLKYVYPIDFIKLHFH